MKTKTLLRTAFTFLVFNFSFFITKAQWVSIPDTNFGTWLSTSTYASCVQGNNTTGWQLDTFCVNTTGSVSMDCFGANITNLTGVQYFDNLQILNCNLNLLSSLPPLPAMVTQLNISNNLFTVMPTLQSGLWTLRCAANQLTSVPALPTNLTYLDCSANFTITSLPALPNTLTELRCGNNQITILPALPNNLSKLHCNDNDLTSLPILPNTLTELRFGNNLVSSLPTTLPTALTILVFYNNQITSIPALPNGLTYLWCSQNPIPVLPALPNALSNLTCRSNLLTSLPALPNSLKYFDCSYNQIGSLPALPDSLIMLICSHNLLTNLPALPRSGLTEVYCNNNQLSSLPELPARINRFACNDNLLTYLPELPDSVGDLWIGNNPLTCLPRLKRFVYFNFAGTLITCLPNYGNVTTSLPVLSNYPRCEIFNPNGCEAFPFIGIRGKTYTDADNNCVKTESDVVYRNVKINLWKGGNLLQQQFTGNQGAYTFETDSLGTYMVTVDTAGLPYNVECPVGGVHSSVLATSDSTDYDKDFDLECKPVNDFAVHSVVGSGAFRPGGIARIYTQTGDLSGFYNLPCATGISGTVAITINGPASYLAPAGGAVTPSSVAGNTVTWNVADFGLSDFNSDFNIKVQTDTTATLGTIICFVVTITPSAADYYPGNNTFIICFVVGTSFDPNNKQVYPLNDVDVNGDHWLTYTINFQNTGNDTAIHIYLSDTLDSDLDVSSFQLLAYSHQPLVQVKENAVRFNFPNIMLPDSNVNEPLSHGYVQYKIKIKDGKPVGTVINNTAFIYFDFNEAVVTNTTTNTIAVVSGIAASHEPRAVRVYPNPASDVVTISVDEGMIGGTAIVTDIAGRKMAAVKLSAVNGQLTTENFANGVYFVTVTDKEGRSATKKLVIQK